LAWQASFATPEVDVDEFAAFRCWDGDKNKPWIEQVENYVRVRVLKAALHTLAFRDGRGELVAVSAFDPTPIEIPVIKPVVHLGWQLQVVAICQRHQRNGRSREVYEQTFAAMRDTNSARTFVTAKIHREHRASLAAANRAGLELLMTGDPFHTMIVDLHDVAS
jgi:hypothetical protein